MTNLREALQSIYDQRGQLTPALVVETAKNTDHPLHHRFEWNDEIAGPKYREVQARELIRSVKITYAETKGGVPKQVRAFVPPRQASAPNVYIPTGEALSDDFTRALVLREFERALIALKRQYGHLREFDQMVRAQLDEGDAA
ncbi:hypothetical protein [Naumannella halotolerans]|uniref:Uncharacterized protein n=1 Tax=Naumannella halotolerans TaxID=993414 RepID=A0A4R7J462_9ACTN|nr:hypothetical protein [Naumannella halotolerans]TDT31137.1 hypothetical protein CLV29_2550 [Naumannella halotolerans]